ncbi:MAG: ABC transporter permease [Acidimicrobiia bacterium]|nr:ABC transporter permease [Acidimicrobiia bacterium]
MNQTNGGSSGFTGTMDDFRRKILEAWSLQPFLVPIYAVILSFVVGGVLIAIIGINPFEAYWALLRGMFGSPERIAGSVARSVPFIGSALALSFAFRAGLFNIGAEGQLLIGGITAAWVGTWAFMADLPGILAIPIILFAGFSGGFLWGGIPGVLRARTGAHEVISTIMLNSIALFMVRWIVNSRDPVILRDVEASVPRTEEIASTAVLPELVDSQPNLHWGLFVMIAVCIILDFVLRRTTFGFETITVGTNPHAAHYAGIGVGRILILAMALSGAFAGLAAASEVSGTNGFFQPGTFAFIGFDGIAIALLARANPIAILPAALLWGSLLSGAPLMQQEADVSIDVVRIIQSMVLLFVAADAIVRYLFRLRGEAGPHIDTASTGWTG